LEGRERISVQEAKALQVEWAGRVEERPLGVEVRLVGGADVSFSGDDKFCMAAIMVFSWPELELMETAEAIEPVRFGYVPGLLSFREAPAILAAARKLKRKPDVLLIDGQGRAHPRRFGLACHVGVELDWPTIGCAKSRLIGEYGQVGQRKGCRRQLKDKGEVVGMVVRSREKVKCLYVSVGHKVELREAVKLVLGCCRRYRQPEPTRRAHQLVSRLRGQGRG